MTHRERDGAAPTEGTEPQEGGPYREGQKKEHPWDPGDYVLDTKDLDIFLIDEVTTTSATGTCLRTESRVELDIENLAHLTDMAWWECHQTILIWLRAWIRKNAPACYRIPPVFYSVMAETASMELADALPGEIPRHEELIKILRINKEFTDLLEYVRP